jgi:hypothetical protein
MMPENLISKKCIRCGEIKQSSEFFSKEDTRDHLSSYCKKCHLSYKRENYNAKVIKGYHLKRVYKITLKDYQDLFLVQGGVCAICHNPETNVYAKNGLIRDLAVDHEHETGRVRGLLCRRCNQAMGLLNEDRNLLQHMTDYLSSFDAEPGISPLPQGSIRISAL